MSTHVTPKIIILSVAYIAITIILIVLLDLGLSWLLNNVIVSILNWFNSLPTLIKIIVIMFGLWGLFFSILEIAGRLSTLIGGLIFHLLPKNGFTLIGSLALSIINSIYSIYELWIIPEHFNFWIVVEMICLSGFIFITNANYGSVRNVQR